MLLRPEIERLGQSSGRARAEIPSHAEAPDLVESLSLSRLEDALETGLVFRSSVAPNWFIMVAISCSRRWEAPASPLLPCC